MIESETRWILRYHNGDIDQFISDENGETCSPNPIDAYFFESEKSAKALEDYLDMTDGRDSCVEDIEAAEFEVMQAQITVDV